MQAEITGCWLFVPKNLFSFLHGLPARSSSYQAWGGWPKEWPKTSQPGSPPWQSLCPSSSVGAHLNSPGPETNRISTHKQLNAGKAKEENISAASFPQFHKIFPITGILVQWASGEPWPVTSVAQTLLNFFPIRELNRAAAFERSDLSRSSNFSLCLHFSRCRFTSPVTWLMAHLDCNRGERRR